VMATAPARSRQRHGTLPERCSTSPSSLRSEARGILFSSRLASGFPLLTNLTRKAP
jgi:hypothetical protein